MQRLENRKHEALNQQWQEEIHPLTPPHILLWDDTLRETCQPCTENQQVDLSGNLAAKGAEPEREQGVAIIPFGWPQQQKWALIWHPVTGEAVTVQVGSSTALYSPIFL